MSVLIKDLCRKRKDELHLTNQDVADRADISVSTVNNYFSSASKAPSVYTVGPICSALGVSLDQYFGIKAIEEPADQSAQLAHIAALEQKCHDYKRELDHKNEIISLKDEAIKAAQEQVAHRRPIIRGLIIVLGILSIAFLAYILHFDLTNPEYGIFKG